MKAVDLVLECRKSNTGEQRMAIEDRKKCDFLKRTFI